MSAEERYHTIASAGQARCTGAGSEFVGHAAPAAEPERPGPFVDSLREEYPDATLVVRYHGGTGPVRRSRPGPSGGDAPGQAQERNQGRVELD